MIKTRQLERKWYKYKAKKVVFILFFLTLVLLLAIGGYYLYGTYMSQKINERVTKIELSNKKIENSLKEVETIEVVEKKEELISIKDEVLLEAIIPIIDMEKEERKSIKVVSVKKNHVLSHSKKRVSKKIKAKKSAYLTANELATINGSLDSRKIKKIKITTTSVNYIETIKQKFIATKNPREALLLAKAYYGKKEYSKSEEWALRANRLNRNLDESWLLFAKSKAKLGKKDEALKILVSYYQKSHSSKAKVLIQKIKTERL